MEDSISYKLLASLLTAGVVGCAAGSTGPSSDPRADFGTLNAASLELTAQGGLAALQQHQLVRHDDRSYVSTNRHLCAPACGAPFDSTSGTLSAAATDSLFNIAWHQTPYSLKDDYGTTQYGADMMTYTLRVTFDGRTKTITADDGSMPSQMRAIVSAMRGIIAATR
ncbi:MAG: hypothetical protein ABI442_18320 [Gemmatimonadaceae bacterium]